MLALPKAGLTVASVTLEFIILTCFSYFIWPSSSKYNPFLVHSSIYFSNLSEDLFKTDQRDLTNN